ELEFLPAALELIETPASPLGRIMMWTIIALASIAFLWACIGKVDIIATAAGRVIPSGQIKLIQPFEIGVVKAIHVTDGDHVRAGDVLIELDPTTNQADQERVERDLVQSKLDVARLSAALTGNADSFVAPTGADPGLTAAARHQLVEMLAQHKAKIDGLDQQIAAKTAERDQAKATIVKVEASLPIVQKRVDIYQKLAANQYSSKVSALEAEQQLVEARDDRAVAKHQLEGAEASIAALQQQKQEADAEARAQTLDDLAKARQKLAELDQEQIKAAQKTDLQTLKAPVDGTVEQLAVHTVGGVVTPAQTMAVVVPEGSKLQIEAMLPNRDVGFVHPGQAAEVKVEAFTYTRYGLIHGTVEGISRDTVQSNGRKPKDGNRQGEDDADSGDGPHEESSYVARVTLSRTSIDTEDGPRQLEPGMAVTAEIKTGRRRVIDYLLSPLARYKHEGMRER
ncbi:MAG TPA: HlyD family type I secretion periplasmic adaptor subunit, partial [Alphaproteobacteria bacterium]|nr:HlyD family type I secretion periplasmic adaptor subunit [Alphaproteobacteria bacterium]